MADPFVGQLALVGFDFAPVSWLTAAGQLLNVRQYAALFGLLGTTYGGDGVNTFALPNLVGAVPIGVGQLPGSPYSYVQGQKGGVPTVTLTSGQLPSHNHFVQANNLKGTLPAPGGNSLSDAKDAVGQLYVNGAKFDTPMSASAVSTFTGGGVPHDNMMPYVCMNWIIAYVGVMPPPPPQ
jgi:microcystin-dependent protein